jgi:hypothetical protein
MYHWPNDPNLRARPFELPVIRVLATLEHGSHRFEVRAPGMHTQIDETLGEVQLPVLVVPAVSVNMEPRVVILPLETNSHDDGNSPDSLQLSVHLRSEASNGNDGDVFLETPAGWTVRPERVPVHFGEEGEQVVAKFTVTPAGSITPGRHAVRAAFQGRNGETFRTGYEVIDYPHTPPRLLFRNAEATVSAFPVVVPERLRVGYIEGAGDGGPNALAQLGIHVERLNSDSVIAGDLSRFDVIIAGIRAYEVRPDLAAANSRLLRWVAAGGTFIVQYQRQEFAAGGFAPYRLGMGRSADRVTDEAATVRLLVPDHSVFTRPNRIEPSDFDGWVQERGLYFMSEWDERFTPLLEMSDPGEPSRQGSLLLARHGQGHYVYVALSLFRQLPEGVAGAYRLLANLVALGAH